MSASSSSSSRAGKQLFQLLGRGLRLVRHQGGQGQGVRKTGAKGGGGGGQPFWSEGTKKPEGLLFGETPPPPGQTRKWESWEAVWYGTLVASGVILAVGLSSKPDNGITTWAHKEAMIRRYGEAGDKQE